MADGLSSVLWGRQWGADVQGTGCCWKMNGFVNWGCSFFVGYDTMNFIRKDGFGERNLKRV